MYSDIANEGIVPNELKGLLISGEGFERDVVGKGDSVARKEENKSV